YGPAVAFGIPGILMGVATVVFWLGRREYVRVPPSRGEDPDAFANVVRTALTAKVEGEGSPGFLVAAFGVALAMALLACWAVKPGFWPEDFGFVISACLA